MSGVEMVKITKDLSDSFFEVEVHTVLHPEDYIYRLSDYVKLPTKLN